MRTDKLQVADFHCDVLSKMQASPDMDFKNDPRLDVTGERLVAGGVELQILRYTFRQGEADLALRMF